MSADHATYGLSLLAGDVRSVAESSALAEAGGLDTAWTAEFYNRSATITLAEMAHRTSRIRIGSGIAYAVGRTPVVLAAEARDLDEVSGGRLVLGLGTGTQRMMRDWHGVDPSSPAVRLEELIPLLRRLWRLHEQPVEHEGRFYRVRLQATAEVLPPLREQIPIFTAGVNPRMIETAGRVSDGFLGHPLFTTSYVQEVVRAQIAAGADRSERDAGAVELAGIVICSVDEDEESARRRAAGQLAFYAAPKTYERVLEHSGFGAAGALIREAFARGDHDAMIAAVSDAMIDAMSASGTSAQVHERLRRYDGILDHVILYPPSWRMDRDEQQHACERLLEVGRALVQEDPGRASKKQAAT